jgi:hypothetical protein
MMLGGYVLAGDPLAGDFEPDSSLFILMAQIVT